LGNPLFIVSIISLRSVLTKRWVKYNFLISFANTMAQLPLGSGLLMLKLMSG
jgi:hypothetical protein